MILNLLIAVCVLVAFGMGYYAGHEDGYKRGFAAGYDSGQARLNDRI